MNFVLDRFEFTDKSTIGTLTCGDFKCFTLEDTDRYLEDNPDGKIYGKTAIPRGTYKVIITYSYRFKKELPLLLNVPGFAGIRIHSGNGPYDTEGCILVGSSHSKDFVGNSRATFAKLLDRIEVALECGNDVELEVM
jgi:hypothetical protein